MLNERKNRFYIAVIGAGMALFAGIYKIFGTSRFTYGENGRLIPLNPAPLEVILITLLVTAVVVGLYQWYKRDRVAGALSSMNEVEREQLLNLLLNEKMRENAAHGEKRKRLQEEKFDDWSNDEVDWDDNRHLSAKHR